MFSRVFTIAIERRELAFCPAVDCDLCNDCQMSMFKVFPILILSTSLAFAGCKKKEDAAATGSAPAKPTEAAPAKAEPAAPAPAAGAAIASDDDYVSKGVALSGKLVGVFQAAGTDCDKLADELTKFMTENSAMIAASKTYEKAHPDAKKKYDEASKDQTAAFEKAAGPAMGACQSNKKLGEAMAKLAAD
jgi:hypothetical protein